MKKRILSIIVTLCVMLTVFSGVCFNTKAVEPSDFNISLHCGYDDSISIGRYVPFYVTLSNTSKDFQGKVQLIIPSSRNNNILYEQEITLPTGVSKTVEIVAPVENDIKLVNVRITDKKGKVITSELQSVKVNRDAYTVRIGVLSDDFSACGYMDNLELFQSPTFRTKIFELTDKNLSENWHGLDMMDVIVISDYSTDLLSDAQKSSLYQWANNGGLLIVGTGATATKTLSGINNIVLDGSASNMQSRNTSFNIDKFCVQVSNYYDYAYYYDENGATLDNKATSQYLGTQPEKIDICDITLNGDGIQSYVADDSYSGDFDLYQYKQCGNGYIVLTGVDFTKNPMPRFAGGRFLIGQIIDATIFEALDEEAANYNSYSYGGYHYSSYDEEDLLDSLSGANMIPLLFFALILVAFFIALLVVYLVSKKKKKTIKLWLIYPIMAVAVSVVIFCISLSTKLNKLTLNVGTIMELSKGAIDETDYVSVVVPRKGDYTVHFNKDYDLDQTTQTGYSYFYEDDVDYDAYRYKYVIGQDTLETCINDAAALSSTDYKLHDAYMTEGGFELSFDGKDFTITNNLDYDVENVLLIYKDVATSQYSSYNTDRFFYYGGIDTLKKGESICTTDTTGFQDTYLRADDLVKEAIGTGDKEYIIASFIGNFSKSYKEFYMRKALIRYVWEDTTIPEYNAMIIAFPKDERCKDVLSTKKGASVNRTEMIVSIINSGDIANAGN